MKTASEILAEVVGIPSVEPTQTDRGEWAGEERLGRFFAEYMEGLGFAVEWQWVREGRPNVWAWG